MIRHLRSPLLTAAMAAGALSLLPAREAEASACSAQGSVLCSINYQCTALGGCVEVSRSYYSNGEIVVVPSGGPTDHDLQ